MTGAKQSRAIRPVHIVTVAAVTAALMVDAFDMFMLGAIGPAIAQDFGQAVSMLKGVLAWQMTGLAIGAFVASPLADKLGRRTLLILCLTVFGVLTLLGAYAQNLDQLAVLRGLSGVALAPILPSGLALVAETTPQARRGLFMAIALTGFSMGAQSSGFVAGWLLPVSGWRIAFWIGGTIPLITAFSMAFVPESQAGATSGAAEEAKVRRGDPRDLFSGRRLRVTVLAWLICLFSISTTALLSNWMPALFRELAGISIVDFGKLAGLGLAGAIAGSLLSGSAADRFGARRATTGYYLVFGASLIGMGLATFGSWPFLLCYLAFSFSLTGGQAGVNTLVALAYPPALRATGLGWAGGAGRIGSILTPFIGGAAVSGHLPLGQVLGLLALGPFLIAGFVLLLEPNHQDADSRQAL